MRYQLDYTPAAQRSLGRLPRTIQQRILKRVETLADNPRPPGSIKLSGKDSYRLRIGDYRVIYLIEDGKLVVLIIDVGHRSDIYRR